MRACYSRCLSLRSISTHCRAKHDTEAIVWVAMLAHAVGGQGTGGTGGSRG